MGELTDITLAAAFYRRGVESGWSAPATNKGEKEAMTIATTNRTSTRRTVFAALALALLALIVAERMAGPVGAEPRSDKVNRANKMIEKCFNEGGDPSVIMDTTGESITIACSFPDGSTVYCDASGWDTCTNTTNLTHAQLNLAIQVTGNVQLTSTPKGVSLDTAKTGVTSVPASRLTIKDR
jgi:hypothetical protein